MELSEPVRLGLTYGFPALGVSLIVHSALAWRLPRNSSWERRRNLVVFMAIGLSWCAVGAWAFVECA
jgi:hypothetical protein